ncbi:MAG: DNA alkylation repair protein [Bryobacteraceae bacterium]
MTVEEILVELERLGSPANIAGMRRYKVCGDKAFGVAMPVLRAMARRVKRDQALAEALWNTGYHEARILASLVGDPAAITEQTMDRWAAEIDSWAVCDALCGNLFDRTPLAWRKAVEWSRRKEEFVRRAGYVLITQLAVHDKKASDDKLLKFLPHLKRGATDERNFVRKAVNWALRQIGKRSPALHEAAIRTAEEIRAMDSKAARWIAADALRELRSDAVRERIQTWRRKSKSQP